MSDPVRQWMRRAQVVVGKGGSGLLVEHLRIQFEVAKTIQETPNTAVIRLYNLNEGHERQIVSNREFDEVVLNAGYEGGMRLVFRGSIRNVYRYREKADYITEIEAGDGDTDYRRATINKTLAAGTTNQQLVDLALDSFAGAGKTILGHTQVDNRARLRGQVVSGNTRDVLRHVARESGANWSIQDGQLVIVKANGVLPNEAIVISAETGMLSAPEISDKGIAVKCLLNPQLVVNCAVKLDSNGIKAKRQKEQEKKQQKERKKDNVRLDPDGIYKVLKVTHKGDTRGQEWLSEVECIGMGQPLPTNEGFSAD